MQQEHEITTLKPCPFCGFSMTDTTDTVKEGEMGRRVVCLTCGTWGPVSPTKNLARRDWNKRVSDCDCFKRGILNGLENSIPIDPDLAERIRKDGYELLCIGKRPEGATHYMEFDASGAPCYFELDEDHPYYSSNPCDIWLRKIKPPKETRPVQATDEDLIQIIRAGFLKIPDVSAVSLTGYEVDEELF